MLGIPYVISRGRSIKLWIRGSNSKTTSTGAVQQVPARRTSVNSAPADIVLVEARARQNGLRSTRRCPACGCAGVGVNVVQSPSGSHRPCGEAARNAMARAQMLMAGSRNMLRMET
jgi:hypothetical protein